MTRDKALEENAGNSPTEKLHKAEPPMNVSTDEDFVSPFEIVEINGKQYRKVTPKAPMKPEEIDQIIGVVVGKSEAQFGWVIALHNGIRFYASSKLESILIDQFDEYKGKEICVVGRGKKVNPRTGRTFFDFDLYVTG